MPSKQMLILAIAFAVAVIAFAVASALGPDQTATGSVRVVQAAEVEWGHLNPLRGDKSPRAGTLWGDRGAPVPCGFLVKFVDGFSSPPHIHPVTYRGMVIHGLVHNDVPTAEEEWLPAGSFWTQPAGEVHITAAKGSANVAYIEIEKGPYLVHPAKDAFEREELPIKLDPESMAWVSAGGGGAEIAPLAGNHQDDEVRRSVVKLPAGFTGSLRSRGPVFHAVVIGGQIRHQVAEKTDDTTLEPGSYFGSEGVVVHRVACDGDGACLVYVRTSGDYEVASE